MTIFLPDAETWSYVLQKHPLASEHLRTALAANNQVVLSAVAWYELRRGFLWREASQPMQGLRQLTAVLPWCDLTPADRGVATSLHPRPDLMPVETDRLLAAQGQRLGATLVTARPQVFGELGITSVNWLER